MNPRDVLLSASQATRDADAVLDEADKIMSIAVAASWLQREGISVHENTVRYWVKRGHLASHPRRNGMKGIRLSVLRTFVDHVSSCPFCHRRAS